VWNELLNIIHTDFSFNGINGDEASCEWLVYSES
jgi:hypothetical protein